MDIFFIIIRCNIWNSNLVHPRDEISFFDSWNETFLSIVFLIRIKESKSKQIC